MEGPGKSTCAVKYSFLKIMTGSDLSRRRLAMMEAVHPEPGPTAWLTGCVHGDEVGGIAVIQELFRKFRKDCLKRGTVRAFPLMNPAGFETSTRHLAMTGEDLNRSFPGDPEGSLAERIAARIMAAITETTPDVALDLHNDWTKSIPYVLVDPAATGPGKGAREKAIAFARASGLLMIDESAAEDGGLSRTLSGCLVGRGVPSLTLELGEANVVNERNVEDGVRAVMGILASLGMADPEPGGFHHSIHPDYGGRLLSYSQKPRSGSSGIIRFRAKPGEVVKKGQKIAAIYNVFGKLRETLRAEREGIVLGHADSSVALPGLPAMAFGQKED